MECLGCGSATASEPSERTPRVTAGFAVGLRQAVQRAGRRIPPQISWIDTQRVRTRMGLSRKRIELSSRTHFARRQQLAFPDHAHEFDAGKRHRG